MTRIYIGGRGHGKTAAQQQWQELGTAGALTLTPEENRFWDEATISTARKLGGTVEMTFQDIHEETMALFLGYGSVAEMRAENEKRRQLAAAAERWSEYPVIRQIPPVKSVRWACPRPTDPVYPKGSPGWMQAQAAARLAPYQWEDNRKLNAKVQAKVSAIYDILGVKPHDSRD